MRQKNILEYLEETVRKCPDKTAFIDESGGLTFGEIQRHAQGIGTYLHLKGHYKEPVVIFMKKSPQTVAAFFGAIYAGCFYIPIDEEMPRARLELILQNVNPRGLICDESTKSLIDRLLYNGNVYCYEDMIRETDSNVLVDIRRKQIDTDPIYIVFTSGSTGVPKGVTACHRSVIDYIESLSWILRTDSETVFGNQVPFYFDACLKEVLLTVKHGGATYLIPKSLFMFPIKLVEYMNEHKINTVCWVASALTMMSGFKVLEKSIPRYLHTVAFGSEVFPAKQFNLWKKALPEARFINLYGPTECTGMSCYYVADREFEPDEAIPIGVPFPNKDVFLLDEDNKEVKDEGIGEICIRGTSLTLGYYGDFNKTSEVFIQNPLNTLYPELIYRTGDLGRYNARGELVFASRKDNQIKHMGHRIELGEIELCANTIEQVPMSCCIYDDNKGKIILIYTGTLEKKEVLACLKDKLPRYMVPNKVINIEKMPLMTNGKIDRVGLKKEYTKL